MMKHQVCCFVLTQSILKACQPTAGNPTRCFWKCLTVYLRTARLLHWVRSVTMEHIHPG